MSRIGKLPITIPAKVEVKLDGKMVTVKGPLGTLSQEVRPEISVKIEDGKVICERNGNQNSVRAFHGLYRALLHNMVVGVSEGFKRELDIVGVGYRCEPKGNSLLFNLGYSHPINFPLPAGITAEVDAKTGHIVLKGADKQLLGQIAANIRSLRPPEPYKGKGIKYSGEHIIRKVGKSASKGKK